MFRYGALHRPLSIRRLTGLPSPQLVTTYSDAYCSFGQNVLEPGKCKTVAAGSYSVDCEALNGNINASYTTILPKSSSAPVRIPTSSTSDSTPTEILTSSASSSDLAEILTSSTSGSTADDTATSSTSSSTPSETPSFSTSSSHPDDISTSSTSTSFSVHPPTLSTPGLQSPISSPTFASASSTPSSGSSRGGENNHIRIIVPSVVSGVLCLLIILVLWQKGWLKSCKGVREDGNNRKESVDPRSLPRNGNRPSRDKSPVTSTHVVNPSTSDMESAYSEFSIPQYPQASLENRTAEAHSS